jgi:dinuclear metal center YbgI/SA1388 family protein
LLTIDLTESVLDEALEQGSEAIVAYHPPIFTGLKRLVPSDPQQRMLLRVIECSLAVYSPHTALDAVEGGVNDWLASAFDVATKRATLPKLGALATGQGRFVELAAPRPLDALVARLKQHLGIAALRVAASRRHADGASIATVSLCAGAGGSVVTRAPADLYVSGEMRHHDVLAAVQRGSSVILCEHTNSERGYLQQLADALRREGLTAVVAAQDRDPLQVC